MQIMLRDREYPALLEELRGKKVLVWSCNTCARLCDVGGTRNAEALAAKLKGDGIDVVGAAATGASCIASNIRKCQDGKEKECDVIVSLTCDIGSALVSRVFGKPSLNPVRTLGTGYRDDDKVYFVFSRDGKGDVSLDSESLRLGLPVGPYARPPLP